MTIKIEIPSGAEFKSLALAIGQALVTYGGGATTSIETTTVAAEVKEVKKSVETVTEAAGSTVTQASDTATVSTQSSEEAGNDQQADAGTAGTSTIEQGTTSSTVGSASNAQSGSNDGAKLDEKGVGFNTDFCGKAAKPFYGSGKDKGQWKKRQGVDKDDYDAWYATSLAAVGTTETAGQDQQVDTSSAFQGQGDNVSQINTAGAFAGGQNGEVVNDGQNHQPQKQGGLTFADAGAFMQWLSEQQAAELITAGDIDSAYESTQSSMGDLFDPSKSANAIAAVYNFLSNIAEGQA